MKRVESGVQSFTADDSGTARASIDGLEICTKDVEYIESEGSCGACLLELTPPVGVDTAAYIVGLGQAAQRYFGRPDFKIVNEAVATQSEDAASLARKEVEGYIGFIFIHAATDLSDEQLVRREGIRALASQLPYPAICILPPSAVQLEQPVVPEMAAPQHALVS
ncbi:MAG TPA: hypothetical protein VK712_01430 [Verrucomicrobiae bacterium]|jgi:hypothetical protein|nr:hypothetical protein [Verrucomicrobiae bacterium]